MMTELLAPAGSVEAMKAAFSAGADAVYIGGQKFGARAYADNPDEDGMLDAISYAHMYGKGLYMTVNTMLKNQELEEELYGYLRPLYEHGLDAVIVQDMGVFSFIREHFPDLSIHCSTQMTISGLESAALAEKMGAVRVVPARELSFQEIRRIRQNTKLEIECFIHGALCYCYSGQCLFSSMLGGRSGNRGKCAQPCRLPYQLYENGRSVNKAVPAYLLSPKDICTVDLLPEILDAGVDSLKIEGRMKQPEYTAGVVEIYRKYLDQTLAGNFRGLADEDRKALLAIFNRDGFSKSYYIQRNGRDMMALQNHKRGQKEALLHNKLYGEIRKRHIDKADKLAISMKGIFYSGQPAVLELWKEGRNLRLEGQLVEEAANSPMDRERICKQLKKTGGTVFQLDALTVDMGKNIFLPVQELNRLRREAFAAWESMVNREANPGRKEAKDYSPPVTSGERIDNRERDKSLKKPYLSASVTSKDQLGRLLAGGDIGRFYLPYHLAEKKQVEEMQKAGKEVFFDLPPMVRDQERGKMKKLIGSIAFDGYLAHTIQEYALLTAMGLEKRTVLDSGLSPWNNRGLALYEDLGMEGDTIPQELNFQEIKERDCSRSELVVYGRTQLMITAQCLLKNTDRCRRENTYLELEDRYNKRFPVECVCDFCSNVIYNSLPLFLGSEIPAISHIPLRGLRFSFSRESGEKADEIVRSFLKSWKDRRVCQIEGETTKGHFRRGV